MDSGNEVRTGRFIHLQEASSYLPKTSGTIAGDFMSSPLVSARKKSDLAESTRILVSSQTYVHDVSSRFCPRMPRNAWKLPAPSTTRHHTYNSPAGHSIFLSRLHPSIPYGHLLQSTRVFDSLVLTCNVSHIPIILYHH